MYNVVYMAVVLFEVIHIHLKTRTMYAQGFNVRYRICCESYRIYNIKNVVFLKQSINLLFLNFYVYLILFSCII